MDLSLIMQEVLLKWPKWDPKLERTDGLDAAGNTTAAIGKGFAIGSAALVSLALYGGFLHNAGLE